MPRLALLTHSLNGGVWTVTQFIAQVLRQCGEYEYDIFFLATSMRDSTSVRLLAPTTWRRGIQIRNAQVEGIPYRHVGAFLVEFEFQRYRPRRQLTDLLNQYDLVQVVSGSPALAGVTRGSTKPVALQVATLSQVERVSRLRQTRGLKGIWLRWMTKFSAIADIQGLKQADVVFVENTWMLEYVSSQCGAGKVQLAPPGVDAHFFTPAPQYAADGYWLWVGRLNEPRKNIPLLLNAYARLVRTCPSIPNLVLVGQGEWQPQYSALLDTLGIADSVQVECNVSQERLADLYRGASVFVLSSDEEGLGMVILEAMASGLPIISTDCGGPATAVIPGENGLLTPVGNAQALAEAMQTLWEQPELRRRMGQAARQRVEERFSIEKAGQVYLDAYARLLTHARR